MSLKHFKTLKFVLTIIPSLFCIYHDLVPLLFIKILIISFRWSFLGMASDLKYRPCFNKVLNLRPVFNSKFLHCLYEAVFLILLPSSYSKLFIFFSRRTFLRQIVNFLHFFRYCFWFFIKILFKNLILYLIS